MEVFQAFYNSCKPMIRIDKVTEPFKLCYLIPPGFEDFSNIIFLFNGNGKFMHYFKGRDKDFCVAFRPGTRTRSLVYRGLPFIETRNKNYTRSMVGINKNMHIIYGLIINCSFNKITT